MSADNGIYIIKIGKKYHVAHAQAIDDINFDTKDKEMLGKWNVVSLMNNFSPNPSNKRGAFTGARIYPNLEMAERFALTLEKEYDFLEYGVCQLEDCPYSLEDLEKHIRDNDLGGKLWFTNFYEKTKVDKLIIM